MARHEPHDETGRRGDEDALVASWDRRFRSMPIVWGQAVSGDGDGVVAGFVTWNGEMWRAEALIFDGERYADWLVGYCRDKSAAVRAVLDPPKHIYCDYDERDTRPNPFGAIEPAKRKRPPRDRPSAAPAKPRIRAFDPATPSTDDRDLRETG